MAKAPKDIALFVCHDLIGLLILNDLVPAMVAQGYRPVIFNTGCKRNRKAKVSPPSEPSFYGAGIVDRALLPFLDAVENAELIRNNDDARAKQSYCGLARLYNCDYLEIDDVNSQETLDRLESYPNMVGGLSVRFLQIFEQKTIDCIEKKGFFWNLHGGILPEYKGLLIPYRAIENGETEYGWTLHRMAQGIDTGDIIAIAKQPLDPLQSILLTYTKMVPDGVQMILSALAEFYTTGLYHRQKQVVVPIVSYYSYPTDVEMEKYRRMGIKFISSPMQFVEGLVADFCGSNQKATVLLRDVLIAAIRDWHDQVQANQNRAAPSDKTRQAV